MQRRELWDRLAAVFFPHSCVFCGAVVEYEDHWCGRCDIPRREQLLYPGEITAAASPLLYAGGAKHAVLALKRHPDKRTARCLAQLMEELFRRCFPSARPGCIVPVPVSGAELRRRGHNHAGLLARALGERMELPVRELLARADGSQKQSALPAAQRARNAERSYHKAPGAAPDGERVLLVDDVYTTGATAAACGRALREAGAERVYVLTATMVEQRQGR